MLRVRRAARLGTECRVRLVVLNKRLHDDHAGYCSQRRPRRTHCNPFLASPNFLVRERDTMSNHIYRVIEIVGTSPDGIDAAIRNGLARAAETMRLLDWFEVQSVRGDLRNGAVAHFQVTLKVGFRLEDA